MEVSIASWQKSGTDTYAGVKNPCCLTIYFKFLHYRFHQTQKIQSWTQSSTGSRGPKSGKLDLCSQASHTTPVIADLSRNDHDFLRTGFALENEDLTWNSIWYKGLHFYRIFVSFFTSHFPIRYCLKDFLVHSRWRALVRKIQRALILFNN